jgi:hypothetical protein
LLNDLLLRIKHQQINLLVLHDRSPHVIGPDAFIRIERDRQEEAPLRFMTAQRRPVEHELAQRVFQVGDLGVLKEALDLHCDRLPLAFCRDEALSAEINVEVSPAAR